MSGFRAWICEGIDEKGLTMFAFAFTDDIRARTLGCGDERGVRFIYTGVADCDATQEGD